MMQTRVKVINCSDALFWYRKYVGSEYEFVVFRTEHDRVWVRDFDGYSNFILLEDMEVV